MSDAKKTILGRRAKFIAAAIAGIGVACGKEKVAEKSPPGTCLSVFYLPDAAANVRDPRNPDGGCTCHPNDPLCSCL